MIENLENKYGKMAGWNSVTYNVFGTDVEAMIDFTYNDNVEIETIYGHGNMPIGYGEGNYSAECGLTLHAEAVASILAAIPQGKRISDAAASDVVIQYEYQDRVVTDIIRNFKITGLGKEVKQGDKMVGQKVECFCTHIDWDTN